MSNPTITTGDSETANRIRGEWEKVKASVQGSSATEIEDPLGADGTLAIVLNSFRHTGAGEVTFRKGTVGEDHRYTRFRAYGPNGSDIVEKSSYLVRADGVKEFHKRKVEAGDKVTATDELDADDQAWANANP